MGMLDGKVALVTAGAGAGIGQAVARRFLEEGADVVLTDAHARRAKDTGLALTSEFGRDVLAMEVDVRSASQVQAMVDAAAEKYGRIDILFNNAGINKLQPIWEMDDENWGTILDITLTGTFRCIRAALPHMIERKSGAIVNMASTAGWGAPSDGEAHYAAAKAGVMALTRAAAAEVAEFGIRVNAIAPSVIYNEFLERIYPREMFERMAKSNPMGRLGKPSDVADLALFLVSDRSAYITGDVVCISGGAVMHA